MATGLLNNPGAVTVEDQDPTGISEGAQDVAKAQGVAYQDIGKTQTDMNEEGQGPDYADYDAGAVDTALESNVSMPTGASYMDDTTSVASQLDTLLNSESPYIKQARMQGEEQAQSRGMLNTSMSAGAAQREAIKAAMPIAQQDAQTAASFNQQQQASENQMEIIQTEAIVSGEIVKQDAAIKQTNQNINNAFQSAMTGAEQQSRGWLQDTQNQFNAGIKDLELTAAEVSQNSEITANRAMQVRDASSSIMQNYQIAVENMMTDPDFLNLGARAVNNAIKQMQTLARNSVKFIGATAGLETSMGTWVDNYLTNVNLL